MGDDTTPMPRPMANMISAVRDGQATVEMKPEDFVYIDRDCEYFKGVIRQIQGLAEQVSRQPSWGLGEENDEMVSGRTVVERFKQKAKLAGEGNDVYSIMNQHYKIVEDLQEVHRAARERMMQADSNFASEFTHLNATLPERPPAQLPAGPYLLPDGTAR
ncbi:hypothetical protein NONI108955_18575 [Nocardia ninae]|uniref:PE domain-containing protein n=1 Tax=Nocardia ninae NBRC 108245 TaxID=1210091 RepID=A0A511MMS2_9NOCA|nr:hypothetical protein [Nocardia ninae]GEM41912.1 hypothetical protein NN4_64310 [Nocardia ninae NBRC 108245]